MKTTEQEMQQLTVNNMTFTCYHTSNEDGWGVRNNRRAPLMTEIERNRYFAGMRAQAEVNGKQLHLLHDDGILKYLIQI